MDYSRPSKCTEPSCGTILHNGASHEAYPQPSSRPAAPVKCSMENCKWIGEITSYEEHRLKKHSPFIAEPIPLSDATHIMVQKEDHEKLQDELGKLTHDLDQFRKLESEKEQEWREKEKEWREKEKEWREAKEARERHEGDLMNCCKRISSQTSVNMSPVIQRGVVANQQIEANSTTSLGRAQQLPQQERSRTLDAEGSDFQQFFSVFEQEGNDHHGENYEQSRPQLEQQNQTRGALVVAPINIPAESESPPPLPPKPKRSTQNDSSSADLIPPKLPPKPNSNGGPPRSQEALRNAQQNDTIPPPRPPKARPAVPQPQRRRKKSPPTPPQDYENDEEGRGMSPLSATDKNSMDSANCGVRIRCPADCHCVCHCVDRRDSNGQLQKNYDSNTKRKAKRCHSE